MKTFNLPDLGEGLPDAEIVEWHVKVGDKVKTDEPMVSMETAKAVVDVPAPMDGTVIKLYGQPGDVIDTGAPLIDFSVEGDGAVAPAAETDDDEDSVEKLRADAQKVLDDLNGDDEPVAADRASDSKGTVVGQMESSDAVIDDSHDFGGKKATPAVRALAKKLKVNLADVTATGEGGVIRPSDVKKAAESAPKEHQTELPLSASDNRPAVAKAPPAPPRAAAPAPAPAPAQADDQWQQVKGTRRTMARAMSASHQQVVPTTLMDDADIHAWQPGEDITARLIRALVTGARAEPALNAWFDGDKLARRLISHVDIGLAVDTPDGLFVPTVRNCERKSADDIRADMNAIKDKVKNRAIAPEDMKDFTLMLSNFGVFAGRYATPVITPPCVAIVAAGKLRHEVVPVMGGMEVHRVIPLSLTFDHRAATGGEAARFLAAVLKDLAAPR